VVDIDTQMEGSTTGNFVALVLTIEMSVLTTMQGGENSVDMLP
jgi:hypothetical protein